MTSPTSNSGESMLSSKITLLTLSLTGALLVAAAPVEAQVERGDPIPLSQYAEVEQAVAWASLTVTWRRPVARGRHLFGALVPWDESWTPSADSAAVLTSTSPFTIAGNEVEAGSYAIWMVPRASGEWTLILSQPARVFHAPYPGPDGDVLRVSLRSGEGEHVESLGFSFPRVEGTEADLRMQWGRTSLLIPIEVR